MKNLKKLVVLTIILLASNSYSQPIMPGMKDPSQAAIHMQNAILAKVNKKTISVLDVKKKMDIFLHNRYEDEAKSPIVKYQFYTNSWKHFLDELIHTELILAQAESKEIKISDGEIREEIEKRFGPKVILTLEKLNVSYDEVFEILKTEMIVERMKWFFINTKVLQAVTPHLIRNEYRKYCKENPPKESWEYQVVSIRGDQKLNKDVSNQVYDLLQNKSLDDAQEDISNIENKYENVKITKSNSIHLSEKEISTSHKKILNDLTSKQYSNPIFQKTRTSQDGVYKIFFLKSHSKEEMPSFEQMNNQIKNELLNVLFQKESDQYYKKLKDYYNFNENLMIPEDFQPFSVE
jgi:hypothetical protein